jgi:methylated-DNA-[protein]-cysteine S-methyltransferase
MTEFQKCTYEFCKKIPKGKVSTYGALAKAMGRPKAFRAVGNALNKNPFAPKVPCHRVVSSTGSLGGYAFGSKKKIKILKAEGVVVLDNKIENFKNRLFNF